MRILFILLTASLAAAPVHAGIIINEDNSHFYFSRDADAMTRDGLEAWVDQYADTAVTHLFLNPNAMRTSYQSAVWETIGDYDDEKHEPTDAGGKQWAANVQLLIARGLDPYAIWIARARHHGMSPWLSMRMNDVHDVDNPNSYMHSTLWREHPELRRMPPGEGGWFGQALDFGRVEVRDHALRLIDELLTRYDMDGVELDWMRFGFHFKPGEEEAGRVILTEFVRTVREKTSAAAERLGHPVKLGVRVPTHPKTAVALGMDAVTWAKEGLVDMIVPTPFWATAYFDIPLEDWDAALGDARGSVALAPGLEVRVEALPGGPFTMTNDAYRAAFAASMHARGADHLYFFNHMDNGPNPAANTEYHAFLKQGFAPERVTKVERWYPVVFRDTTAPDEDYTPPLPAGANGATFSIHIGPAPTTGAALIVAGINTHSGEVPQLETSVNDTQCGPSNSSEIQLPDGEDVIEIAVPIDALNDGYNTLTFSTEQQVEIVWVELRLQPAGR